MSNNLSSSDLDVIVVGGGFGGCYLLRNLRMQGFKVKVFEEGEGLGGVWWHNRYPGARVDTSAPYYEFSAPELWEEWVWREAYPSQAELVEYFQYVDRKWDLSKDITFGARVTKATFDESSDQWTVNTNRGDTATARFLLLSTGFAAKLYVPHLEGLEKFQGFTCHTARWPEEDINFKGKRVGVIGTGASGVQVIQELGPIAGELVVLQRSINCALPMGQQVLSRDLEMAKKTGYAEVFRLMKLSHAGFDYSPVPRKAKDEDPATRTAFFEELWARAGFAPSQGNYDDLMTDIDTNTLFYNFWRDKVRKRITKNDPELIENLAPELPPVPFGTKRPSLEQSYFEVFNEDNVNLVNLQKNPIAEVTKNGVEMRDGTHIELDALILATGFDAITGSFSRIDIQGVDGQPLRKKWSSGTRTSLGMSTSGFPNMFFLYGPQSPTAFAVGPVISEIQSDWIIKTLVELRTKKLTRIDAKPDFEHEWTKRVADDTNKTLLPRNTTSWYMAANVPGKPRESLNFVAGLPAYQKALRDCAQSGWSLYNLQ